MASTALAFPSRSAVGQPGPRAVTLSPVDIVALSRLLDVAIDLDAVQVDGWLASLAVEDQHLKPVLLKMLEGRKQCAWSDFLSKGPTLKLPPIEESGSVVGDQVGPYRLIRQLGRGGMGTVWLAERSDGGLKRFVALKLPRLAWEEGLAQRMERERDIAALLEHPHIARLYDAGVDERGRPYLALEYVDGIPLDAWCRSNLLSIPERLRLFQQIASAVIYAHGRLVVHRDIKPSNVLITKDGNARLLDFGIAKLLSDAASNEGLTHEHGMMLTPRSASPEQLSGGTITVASDVYSLGVLLYEMLTGTHPYVVKRNTAAAFEEAIVEGEAVLASHRADDRVTARQLRGDLDAILAKALRREPTARFATVDAMAADIARHLNGDAVLARPDRLSYRVSRAMRRHRAAVVAVAIVVLAVVGGASKSMIEARRANAEAERARLVKEFVVDIFSARAGPDGAMAQMPGIFLLERSAGAIASKFGEQPLLQAELEGVVSTMFYNVANLEQAATYAERRAHTLISARAPDAEIARAWLALSEILIPSERNGEALDSAQRALDRAGGDKAIEARAHASKALALLFGRADTEQAQAELDAAEAAIAVMPTSLSDRAAVAHARGIWFAFKHLPDQARARFDEAISLGEAAEGPTSILALYGREEAAKTLLFAERFEDAKVYLEKAIAMMQAAGGPNDARAAIWQSFGANWLFRGDAISFASAIQTYEKSLAILRSQKWAVPQGEIDAIERRMGLASIQWGDIERGIEWVGSAIQDAGSGKDPLAQWWHNSIAVQALSPTDRAGEAVPLAKRMLPTHPGQPNYDLRSSYKALAVALIHARRYQEAETVLADFDRTAPNAKPVEPESGSGMTLDAVRALVALELGKPDRVLAMTEHLPTRERVHQDEVAWLSRAASLCETGAAEAGQALFEAWLPRLAMGRYEYSPHLAYWRARMGLCQLRQGKLADAAHAAKLAHLALVNQPRASAHYKAPVTELEQKVRHRYRIGPSGKQEALS